MEDSNETRSKDFDHFSVSNFHCLNALSREFAASRSSSFNFLSAAQEKSTMMSLKISCFKDSGMSVILSGEG